MSVRVCSDVCQFRKCTKEGWAVKVNRFSNYVLINGYWILLTKTLDSMCIAIYMTFPNSYLWNE